jgi:L-2,4-diaminobutyric acid acetyltransferase
MNMTLAGAQADDDRARATHPFEFRQPTKADAAAVWRLIADCPPLDRNSMYCNLLQCSDFAETCRIAEDGGALRGWVSGYLPPEDPQSLFIWQVAVHEAARGHGLAKKLLKDNWAGAAAKGARFLKTTITRDNKASWALFRSFAEDMGAPVKDEPWFEKDAHFGGEHDTEYLVTIGPIPEAN